MWGPAAPGRMLARRITRPISTLRVLAHQQECETTQSVDLTTRPHHRAAVPCAEVCWGLRIEEADRRSDHRLALELLLALSRLAQTYRSLARRCGS